MAIMLFLPCLTWAWGCTGHEVVALVALDRMGSGIRAKLDHALAKVPRAYPNRYCTEIDLPAAAYFATWADDYRNDHKETGPWHYWDVPLENSAAAASDYCEDGCVVRAITDQLAIMKDRSKPEEERLHALMFVIHFVGDIHQPLHAEDNLDRGGNCVPVDFLKKHTEPRLHDGKPTANYSPNLHGIWDTDLVEYVGGVTTRSNDLVRTFAESLNHKYASKMAKWKRQRDPVIWALESHDAARDEAYKFLSPPIAPVHYTHPVQDCSENDTSAKHLARREIADAKYTAAVKDEVEMRLAAAGIRLAALLDKNWPGDWK